MIYGIRSSGNSHGVVQTKPIVVKTMLDRVGYVSKKNLSGIKVLEPSAGEGAFAVEIIERLYLSSLEFGFSFQVALRNLTFFEIEECIAAKLYTRINTLLKNMSAFMPKDIIQVEDFLLSETGKFDLIVGNPPYVRHENIPEEQKRIYRKNFSTFRYRSDIYIAFFEKSLGMLDDEGVLSFICSNRWLKNQYGQRLRNLIRKEYSLTEIIDLEETCPFEENVIAYPAITTICKAGNQNNTNYYHVRDVSQLTDLTRLSVEKKTIRTNHSNNWFSYQLEGKPHERFLDSIENQGFKIGIGVATGLDRVFIRKDFNTLIEDELLLPLVLSRDLKNNQLKWSGNYIFNPFDSTGELIRLNRYPKAEKYLEEHREYLGKRHVAKKNPALWYRTIDRIYPELTKQHKILLPDISGNNYLFIDKGDFYPHHNLYYITCNDIEKLELLAAILMSDFVKKQLLKFGTKMNGGYPRWQAQNLKKLRIPVIASIPNEIAESIRKAYHEKNHEMINALVTEDQISEFGVVVGQLSLF